MSSGLIAEGEGELTRAGQGTGEAWLVPMAGPPLEVLKLTDTPGGVVLGRGDTAHVRVPLSADKVSRAHCRFLCDAGEWTLTDESRWGTFVNGVRLEQGKPFALRDGDQVRIAPWTFNFTRSQPRGRGIDLAEDTAAANDVRAVEEASARNLGSNLVDLLTGSTEHIHAARNESELANALLDVALKGTGLTNAAVLKVVDAAGRVEPIAARLSPGATGQALFSRSLVARARMGQVAELRMDAMSGANIGESVMTMKISAAICAPLLIGDGSAPAGERDVAALLYLDSRQSPGVPPKASPNPNAAGFVMALARIGSLALANLKRMEMAVRVKETETDLAAAAEAQRLIFPAREGKIGPFTYHGESKPGQSVGGDFFDVVDAGDGKFAVALGDVTGKGVPASVLMTASFGFLHSLLASGTDPAAAAIALNRFLHPRRPASRFVTLWIGVFDLKARTLTYVDCGHGWACLKHPDGTFEHLDHGGGLPCAIDDEWIYTSVTVPLRPGSRAVIVSDGYVEQFGLTVDDSGKPVREQFGMDGIKKALSTNRADDELKALLDAVVQYAGTPHLSDDATAIIVRWD